MDWDQIYHYGIPFFTLILSGFAIPVPEEIVVTAAGVLCGSNAEILWSAMIAVCLCGIALGDSALYLIGWLWGAKLVQKEWVKRKLLAEDKREKIKQNYHEYGIMIVLFARIVPGIRTPVFLMAGILKLPFKRFMLLDAICAIPNVIIFFSLGYWFTDQFLAALKRVEGHRPLVFVVVLAGIGGYVLYSFQRRKVTTGDPTNIPVIGGQLGAMAHHQHVKHEEEEHPMPAPEIDAAKPAATGP